MSLSRGNVGIKTQKYTHFSDFVMRLIRPSVKSPQTEKMRSTNKKTTTTKIYNAHIQSRVMNRRCGLCVSVAKACDADALVRSCANGASRRYT